MRRSGSGSRNVEYDGIFKGFMQILDLLASFHPWRFQKVWLWRLLWPIYILPSRKWIVSVSVKLVFLSCYLWKWIVKAPSLSEMSVAHTTWLIWPRSIAAKSRVNKPSVCNSAVHATCVHVWVSGQEADLENTEMLQTLKWKVVESSHRKMLHNCPLMTPHTVWHRLS